MVKNVVSVIDGEAGSCGKTKVIGEIATDKNIRLGAAITNCMPNAGHTFMSLDGEQTVFHNIPVSIVNPKTELFIGPGSAINMESFKIEYKNALKYLGDRHIYIHELVPLIESRHKEYEKKMIKSGSTYKGCGAVTQEKIMRNNQLTFFKTFRNAIVCSNQEWLDRLYNHLDNDLEYVLLEGAQGCDLDLNHSGNYPYVTSRNVSTTQLLSDSGISAERLLQTIMVIRPFPIRISNITDTGEFAYTGSYGNGAELTWSSINIASMTKSYPTICDGETFEKIFSRKQIQKLFHECPELYLKQLFGENYKQVDLKKISVMEALELERLTLKSKGIYCYNSKVIDLGVLGIEKLIDQSEQTTVTKMERRIFDLDMEKLKNNCRINTPSSLYLNFFQHLDFDCKGIIRNYDDESYNHYIREYLNWLESSTEIEISALGTGPRNGERILRKNLMREIKRVF